MYVNKQVSSFASTKFSDLVHATTSGITLNPSFGHLQVPPPHVIYIHIMGSNI